MDLKLMEDVSSSSLTILDTFIKNNIYPIKSPSNGDSNEFFVFVLGKRLYAFDKLFYKQKQRRLHQR